MTLEPGSRVGGYEILAPLGAGGMGEVYRARDHRLGRDVALKVLPESLLDNQDRLHRFQREAQTAGGLSHPNLLTVHELGVDAGRPFIVSELIEGSTLRERMSAGPLPPKRAIDYAAQIAEGLAAAHERGVVHRDLKPENIAVTRDGRVKILDFGLAKTTTRATSPPADGTTVARNSTEPGAVLGTAGYMSPEQVRGEVVDSRSDIFSLGAILYEMLSGRRAFEGSSSVDTMHAILHRDPPELSQTNADIPPALHRIADHCLEKDRERRFQSARDLAFDLANVSGTSAELIAPKHRARMPSVALWLVAMAAVAAIAAFAGRELARGSVPTFQRLTFRPRFAPLGLFTPDQQSFIYSNQGHPEQMDVSIFPIGSAEGRPIGLHQAFATSVSRNGELAVLLNARFEGGFTFRGTLGRVPIGGGAPKEIAEDVDWADWTPSGDALLVLRRINGKARIELPVGNVLYETPGWISTPRISPDGQSIAFVDHPFLGDDSGSVALVTSGRKAKVLTPMYASLEGLAWKSDDKEILYTGAEKGNARVLYGVTPSGRLRRIASSAGALTICDIARDGRILIVQGNDRVRAFVGSVNEPVDHEMGWLDWSTVRAISNDGSLLLFEESGEGGGKNYSVYVRRTDGSPPIRLGDGIGVDLSRDGKFALAIAPLNGRPQLVVYPIGAGEPRRVTADKLKYESARWAAGGAILARASDGEHPQRVYLLSGGAPRPLTAEGVTQGPFVSADGRRFCARMSNGIVAVYSIDGRVETTLPEIGRQFAIGGWSADGSDLFLMARVAHPSPIYRFNLATRQMQLLKSIVTQESTLGTAGFVMTPDGRKYAYSMADSASDLYLLEGAK
ncbi:MAG TPA: protein kinase [Thermoanaerobaculia bacterium]